MIFSSEDQLQVDIKLEDTSLDQVNRFKYLGVTPRGKLGNGE